jgi:thioesterase domain-containing protein
MGYFADRLRKRSRPSASLWNLGDTDEELESYLLRTGTVHARYHAIPFDGKASIFLARDTLWRVCPEKDPRLDWGSFIAKGFETFEIPGDHALVIREPNVRVLAQRLNHCLEKVHAVVILIFFLGAIFSSYMEQAWV